MRITDARLDQDLTGTNRLRILGQKRSMLSFRGSITDQQEHHHREREVA